MTDLRGRARRYFGYARDTKYKVDTPESARSFRSIISPVEGTAKRRYEAVKHFFPDQAGQSRFADKIIHRAVKTQIPGLLPALRNSPQFAPIEDTPIYLRSPEFEQHKNRSQHYFWLPRGDRSELCDIFHRHVKPKEKRAARMKNLFNQSKLKGLSGFAAEAVVLEQQDFLQQIAKEQKIFKTKKEKTDEVSEDVIRQNRKFQMSYWDPTTHKNLSDPFNRGRNKIPALDAVCHAHFGPPPHEYNDLLTCVHEYNKRQIENKDLVCNQVELQDAKEHARRLSLFGSLQEEEKRRGHKHIKPLYEYDQEDDALWKMQAKILVSAGEYINKIRSGRRFPTPPKEVHHHHKRKKRSSGALDGGSDFARRASSTRLDEYLNKIHGKRLHTHTHRHENYSIGSQMLNRHRAKHDYSSDDFYMEMYLHFLNPEEDTSLKQIPKPLTDVKELRKKMNLDEDREGDKKLFEMLNTDSDVNLHFHEVHHQEHAAHTQLSPEQREHEKKMLMEHLERLKNPRVMGMLGSILSQVSMTSSSITISTDSEATTDLGDLDQQMHAELMEKTRPLGLGTLEDEEESEDDDLDVLGDIPEHELKLIMNEIADSDVDSLYSEPSSASSGEEEEVVEEEEGEEEGAAVPDQMTLFTKARRTKDTPEDELKLIMNEIADSDVDSLSSEHSSASSAEEEDAVEDEEEGDEKEGVDVPDQITIFKKARRRRRKKDIPEHELKLSVNEVADSDIDSLSSEPSSVSSVGDDDVVEKEEEGAAKPDQMTLLKKARRKKYSISMTEFMDVTAELRAQVCPRGNPRLRENMHPLERAVCGPYPGGPKKKMSKSKKNVSASNIPSHNILKMRNVLTSNINF